MLNVDIDLTPLENLANLETLQKIGDEAAKKLTALTQAKIMEFAGQRLHSRLTKFQKGVTITEESSGVFIIHLDDKLGWIEDGVPAHSMIPDFINSPKAKTAKDGHKYMNVPFRTTSGESGPTQTTPYQQDIVKEVKKQLKKEKISFSKIETDDQGRPKLGLLHKIKVKTPLKTREGPGMGWGDVGKPRVGSTGKEFMAGASVHQFKDDQGRVKRGVVTFRVASEKQLGTDLWNYPGLEPTHIFQDAYEWALKELELSVMPEIISKINELSK